jgi:hypothetical protein
MYERIARTGPSIAAMKPPPPRLKVNSFRAQPLGPTMALSPSRMSTPVAEPAVILSPSTIQRPGKVCS